MKRIIINFLVIFIINIHSPNQVNSANKLHFYINDFYKNQIERA